MYIKKYIFKNTLIYIYRLCCLKNISEFRLLYKIMLHVLRILQVEFVIYNFIIHISRKFEFLKGFILLSLEKNITCTLKNIIFNFNFCVVWRIYLNFDYSTKFHYKVERTENTPYTLHVVHNDHITSKIFHSEFNSNGWNTEILCKYLLNWRMNNYQEMKKNSSLVCVRNLSRRRNGRSFRI